MPPTFTLYFFGLPNSVKAAAGKSRQAFVNPFHFSKQFYPSLTFHPILFPLAPVDMSYLFR